MIRLFVGLDLPDAIKQTLLGCAGGVEGARWQTADQMHLTLRFIGDVEEQVGEAALEALGTVRHVPFEMHLEACGFFGKPSKPRVIYASAKPAGPLKSLHEKIDNALRAGGIPPDERKFTPHVTLARLKGAKAGRVVDYVAAHSGLRTPAFEVDAFHLFQSTLSHSGAQYDIVASFGD